ncbi:MAG: DUF1800 family protein [Verrucomicrobiales bacterium]|nr:DUF1800 family protein [Verrucomicrobiales bacterium]
MHRSSTLCLIAAHLLGVMNAHAFTDFDADGYDDVWQRLYNVTVSDLPLSGDFDSDGSSNSAESIAGTDPRDASSYPKVSDVQRVSSNMVLKTPTQTGKRYQLQSSETLGAESWVNDGAAFIGDGSVHDFSADAGSNRKFFHVSVDDADSDGDGVSDYAEALLGTNPTLANSPTNASGGAASDYDTLRSLLSISISVVTTDAFEQESTPAVLRLTRAFGTMPLAVQFAGSGGALDPTKANASAADYTITNASFANGETTHDVAVNALLDAVNEVPEALKLTLKLPGLSPFSTAPSANVTLKDASVNPVNRRLFVAYLNAVPGVSSIGSGVATLFVEGDNNSAVVNLSFNNLSSEQNTAYLRIGSNLEVQVLPKGQITGASWSIRAKQFLLTDQAMLDALAAGQVFLSISSANFTAGEIQGFFAPANGSVSEPPTPAAAPTYTSAEFPNLAAGGVTNNAALDRDIVRFLQQATFGPTAESIQEVRDLITANGNDAIAGYTAWIDKQMDLAQTPSPSLLKLTRAADLEDFMLRGNKPVTYNNDPQFGGGGFQFINATRSWAVDSIWGNNHPFLYNRRREWWTIALNSKDQLRQRMAFALSQIAVISEVDTSVFTYHHGTANYWDMLTANAFGPYRTVLEKVTYSPMMGVYLSHLKNQARNGTINPDENFAREIMQLFSIGLVQRYADGSLKLDAVSGLPIPTYDQGDITEMARVMTGMSFSVRHALTTAATYPTSTQQRIGTLLTNTDFFTNNGHLWWQSQWTSDLGMFSAYHDFNDYPSYTGLTYPEGVTSASKILFRDKPGQKVIPIRTVSNANGNLDVADALDALATHPNIAPFISRLLIQRFVTSNPSRGYLHRVATTWTETSGNLGEVMKAILLDYEARSHALAESTATFGKPKEPLLRYTAALRGLKSYTGLPLVNLTTLSVPFTSSESMQTTPYELSEFNKFPAGTKRFRYFNMNSTIFQSPQAAPTVFNWFLPDYVFPGPTAAAGLVVPEFQIATESSVVKITNEFYNVMFTSIPPGGASPPVKPGRTLDDVFNLAGYRTATNGSLVVPSYGVSAGYFSANTFNSSAGSTETPETINNDLDNVLPDYGELTTLYTSTYNSTLTALYAPNPVPTTPTTANRNLAHDAAALAVLDQCDLLFAAGVFKTRYAALPPGTNSPRQAIIDALASGIGSRTTHTDAASNGFLTNAQRRCRNIAFLVLTSPQSSILK